MLSFMMMIDMSKENTLLSNIINHSCAVSMNHLYYNHTPRKVYDTCVQWNDVNLAFGVSWKKYETIVGYSFKYLSTCWDI